jgi:hypothetical protein
MGYSGGALSKQTVQTTLGMVVLVLLLLAGCGETPLVAKADATRWAFIGDQVTLDASASTHAGGTTLSYRWTFVSRPAGSKVLLSSSSAVNPSFTVDLAGTYLLSLVVNDGKADSAPASVMVTATLIPTEVVVIGNSLTHYNPVPELGWYGSWGMAASAADRDFAHLVAASLQLPLSSALSFSGLELTPATSAGAIPLMAAPVKATTLVIIQLGDNVQLGVLPEFAPQYNKLLDAVQQAGIVICTSTWWRDDTKDALIETACTAHGGRYVFIGDLKTNRASLDGLGAQFSDPGVNAHPHDWGMAQIAERILASVH